MKTEFIRRRCATFMHLSFGLGGVAVAVLLAAILMSPAASTKARTQGMNHKQQLLASVPAKAISDEQQLHARLPQTERRGPGDQTLVPNRVVVKFAPWADARVMAAVTQGAGGARLEKPSYADFHYVALSPGVDPQSAAARLARQSSVIYAEPDPIVRPFFVPNDPVYRYQWNLQKIGMEKAWDINPGATSGIIVAVIDSGVAFLTKGGFVKAPDLAGTTFVSPHDFIWDDEEPVDMDGHGTHVTGTIAQTTNNGVGAAGIAFNVRIMPVKAICGEWDIAWGAPLPTGCGGATVARAVRYAVDNGARVVNLSLGSTQPSTPMRDALSYAVSRGAVVVIAAGNDAERGNPVEYPASYSDLEGVITVGSLDYDLNRAYYSGYQSYVEIAAPGGDTRVDKNGDGYADGIFQQTLNLNDVASGRFDHFAYYAFQGTSMAAPHAAGFAALLMDQGITSPAAIEAAMEKFATESGAAGRDDQTGFGVINPRATLRGLGLAK